MNDVSILKKELKMWEEYKNVVHEKSLEKERVDRTVQEFIRSEEKIDIIQEKIQHEINKYLDVINNIEDSIVRQACFYKWVEGKTWVQIGVKMGITDEAIRVRVLRYLKKMKIGDTGEEQRRKNGV